MVKRRTTFYPLRWLLAAVFLSICGCQSVKTEEHWYPNYSPYRIAYPKKIVVYVHGYNGTDKTFDIVPYLDLEEEGITPMYFSYKTELLFFYGSLDSIGVTAESLREFIHEKVFNRAPKQRFEVTIVCHSTGCPIALNYVVNNPIDHGIKTIITVAGAHYGAEPAEIWSKWWRSPLTNKQINELKYGSTSLFNMQAKLHHLLEKQKSPVQQEPELQNTAFKGFQYFINKDFDEALKNQCLHLNLPEVISVVGRDGLCAFGDEYSDEIIRVESAIPDCRLLKNAPASIAEINRLTPWNKACDDRFILFLPCDHTSLFSDSKCREPILELIKYVLPHKNSAEGKKRKEKYEQRLTEKYLQAIGNQENFKSYYLKGLSMAALWIKLEYPHNAKASGQGTQTKADNTIHAKVFLSDSGNCTEEPEYVDSITMSDFIHFKKAIRTSKFLPETIYYYKHLKAPQTLCLEISQDGKPLTLRRIIRSETQGEVSKNLIFSVNPAQTTMIWCKEYTHKELNSQMDCEVITESRNSF